jgi:hypothetical protein
MFSSPNNDDIILTSINNGSESNVHDTHKKQVEELSSSDTCRRPIHTRQLLACFMDYINLGKFLNLSHLKKCT